MIAKITKTTYIDIGSIVYIEGMFDEKDIKKWKVVVSFGNTLVEFSGEVAKTIYDAYEWKVRGHATDMIPGSHNYKKSVK